MREGKEREERWYSERVGFAAVSAIPGAGNGPVVA